MKASREVCPILLLSQLNAYVKQLTTLVITDGVHSIVAGDDAIAIHGTYEVVAQVIPANNTVTVAYWSCNDPSCLPINVGDSLLMYAPNMTNLGSAVVASIVSTTQPADVTGTSSTSPAFSYDQAAFFNVSHLLLPHPGPSMSFLDKNCAIV